jgi:biopolymer transport protein ExbB/TolQ
MQMINIPMEQLMFYIAIALSVCCVVLLILVIISLCKLKTLKRRVDSLTRGKDTESMEDIILSYLQRVESLEEGEEITRAALTAIKDNLKITYQKKGLVKYDAFREMSGALSYSLALLDKENNGVLISSMYSREGCYTYAKDIVNGESKINLSEEEAEALKQAMNQ